MINTTSTTIQSLIADLNHFNTEIVRLMNKDVNDKAQRNSLINMHSESMQSAMCKLLDLRHVAVPTLDKNQHGVNLFKAVAI